MKASKALRSSSRTYSSSLPDSYRSLTSKKYTCKAVLNSAGPNPVSLFEEGQNWENLKACTFQASPIYFAWINFRE